MTEINKDIIVSVVLPAFNAENYISEAIESILNQSFKAFELIIIDDGSSDGTLEISRRYATIDNRMVLVSRENRGLVDSLNEGISIARGQWIARMDADDIALPNRLALQLAMLDKTGADICGGWVEFFGASDGRILKHPIGDDAIKAALFFGSAFAHPTVIMKTEFVKYLKYDKHWEKCEDYDLWQRAAYAGWKMANVPQVVLRYRQHEAQISSASWNMQQELTQKLRLRHWNMASKKMQIKAEWIDELIKLRQPVPSCVNLEFINFALSGLIIYTTDEARLTVFDHAFKLYIRAAASSSNVVRTWCQLNKDFGVKPSLQAIINLSLLSILRIGPGSYIFNKFKLIALKSSVLSK